MLYIWNISWFDSSCDERERSIIAETEEAAIEKCFAQEKEEDSDFEKECDVSHGPFVRKIEEIDGYEILVGRKM